jgi:hypothetical protein
MTPIPYASRRHVARCPSAIAVEIEPTCFSCAGVLSLGPARARGFCADCWERARARVPAGELGGEA